MDAVGEILAERREERLSWGPAGLLTLLLHAGVFAAIVLSALAHPIRYAPPRAVAVRLLSAGSLRTAAPPPSPPPETAPPPAAPKPKIEKPPVEEAPKPSKNALLLPPKKEDRKKPTPPPVSRPGRASEPAVSLPTSGEEPGGTPGPAGAGGTAGIGNLKLDQADFKYPVYIERLVGLISMNWFKPAQTVQTSPVVHFQIERDGTITDPRIVTSSGLPFVDRAALRAVYASSPLPPLPAEYGGPHLGIQVVFE